jgi:hypothetical protein
LRRCSVADAPDERQYYPGNRRRQSDAQEFGEPALRPNLIEHAVIIILLSLSVIFRVYLRLLRGTLHRTSNSSSKQTFSRSPNITLQEQARIFSSCNLKNLQLFKQVARITTLFFFHILIQQTNK